MLRAQSCVVLGFSLVLGLAIPRAAAAATGETAPYEYSPLPPPAAPIGEPPPPARAPRPRPAPAVAPPPTTTTSASLPPSSPVGTPTSPPPEPDDPGARGPHTATLDDDRFTLAPFVGFATNNLDLGVGVRAGTTVVAHLWIGGTFVYHAGTSRAGIANNVAYEASSSMFYAGPEAGYDFEVGPVIVRPYAGLGLGAFTTSVSNGGIGVSDTTTKVLIWPGATVLWGLPRTRFFFGGDSRLVSVPGGPAFAAYGVGGMAF